MKAVLLSEVLWEKYAIPLDVAASVCASFLRAFRKCPENTEMGLHEWRRLLWAKALNCYSSLVDEVYQKWVHLRYYYLSLDTNIKNFLVELHKHYNLALITNGPSHSQWEKINMLNLRSYFDVILVSGDLRWEKPHHKIFHMACEELHVSPCQCIMVGDKLETDILGGIKAKLAYTVWIPLSPTESLKKNDPQPDYVIHDVTRLWNILDKSKCLECLNSPDLCDSNSNQSDGS
ncbi:N-acylneuraminate-9-phosphatase isoform X2 [Agrilus planipennis]|uniref:N-acylneuraminate-9-phosphatase isoform X2 n=1 Tax=Agrilus planipennis TaxID=224129 RepID=A0A1W4XMY4_AGRPL|nr:N-acylneuraminate-9-phosphatase isoform X2 [Agrilus planipennis]